jgi:transposase-like protein
MPKINNLKELIAKFSDETVARHYMEQLRWNGNPTCPHCGQDKPYKLKDGKSYRCKSKTCRKDFTVSVGSIFENSKIPLSSWLVAIYLCTAHKKGISSCQLARDLSITQKTAWFMIHRIREMVKPKVKPELKDIVEADVTWFGGKEKNKSVKKRMQLVTGERVPEKTPMFGMVDRNGSYTLTVVANEKAETLKPLISENADSEAVIITDGATAFTGLENEFKGHIVVNHSKGEYANGIYHNNTIEGAFSQMKRGIYGIYHQVSVKHLQRYCEEFCYRYNTRKLKDAERFELILRNTNGRLNYYELISN